jgi:hypothetical protein
MKFIIDRSKWRCGGHGKHQRGVGLTELLSPEGYMCCLGQVCEQLGASPSHLRKQSAPQRLFRMLSADPREASEIEKLFVCRSEDGHIIATTLSQLAMSINDNGGLTDAEREAQLTKLFADHGHAIEFIGEFKQDEYSHGQDVHFVATQTKG